MGQPLSILRPSPVGAKRGKKLDSEPILFPETEWLASTFNISFHNASGKSTDTRKCTKLEAYDLRQTPYDINLTTTWDELVQGVNGSSQRKFKAQSRAAATQRMYTFGLLEAFMEEVFEEVPIPEIPLLKMVQVNEGPPDRMSVKEGWILHDESINKMMARWVDRITELDTVHHPDLRSKFKHIDTLIKDAEEMLLAGKWLAEFQEAGLSEQRIVSIMLQICVVLETVKETAARAIPESFFSNNTNLRSATVNPSWEYASQDLRYQTFKPNGKYWTEGVRRLLRIKEKEFADPELERPRQPIAGTLTSKGWCPYIVNLLVESPSLYLYAHDSVPYIRKARQAEKHQNHKLCTPSVCVINSNKFDKEGQPHRFFEMDGYGKGHQSEKCFDSCEVGRLDGVLPMLRADSNQVPIGVYGFKAKPATKVDGYIAISHVWADGMGSSAEVGLPMCTVEFITGKMITLTGAGYLGGDIGYWMDSLCIPEDRKFRTKAIGQMASIYENANGVLVMDLGIMALDSTDTVLEQLLRIATSGWMQRVWTLQEGVFAKQLYFQFRERAKNIDELFNNPNLGRVYSPLIRDLKIGALGNLYRLQRLPPSEKRLDFYKYLELIWNRNTGKISDEACAVAGLFGLDAKELRNSPPHQRLSTLLLNVKHLPADIIFLRPGIRARNTTPNFSWAPDSFLKLPEFPNLERGRQALCTPQGLHVSYSTVELDTTVELSYRMQYRSKDVWERLFVKLQDPNTKHIWIIKLDCPTLQLVEGCGECNDVYRDVITPLQLEEYYEKESNQEGLWASWTQHDRDKHQQPETCNALIFRKYPWELADEKLGTAGNGKRPVVCKEVLLVHLEKKRPQVQASSKAIEIRRVQIVERIRTSCRIMSTSENWTNWGRSKTDMVTEGVITGSLNNHLLFQ